MNVEAPRLQSVLCALDVDGSTWGPLSVASLIAHGFRASVDALYAPAPLTSFDGRVERVRRLIAEHQARERLQAMLAPFGNSLRVAPYITRGRPSTVILSHSESHRSDLIVLGSPKRARRGDPGAAVADPVSFAASCAVLTVRSSTPECAMRRILLPVGSLLQARSATGWAISLARRFAARVEVVRLAPSGSGFWRALAMPVAAGTDQRNEQRAAQLTNLVMSRLDEAGVEGTLRPDVSDTAGIVSLADSAAFDLVVVGLQAPGSELGDGETLARALRYRTDVPVLSVRDAAAGSLFARGGHSYGELHSDQPELGILA